MSTEFVMAPEPKEPIQFNILVAEDHVMWQLSIFKVLKTFQDYINKEAEGQFTVEFNIAPARSGSVAVAIFEQFPNIKWDIVISDKSMPEPNDSAAFDLEKSVLYNPLKLSLAKLKIPLDMKFEKGKCEDGLSLIQYVSSNLQATKLIFQSSDGAEYLRQILSKTTIPPDTVVCLNKTDIAPAKRSNLFSSFRDCVNSRVEEVARSQAEKLTDLKTLQTFFQSGFEQKLKADDERLEADAKSRAKAVMKDLAAMRIKETSDSDASKPTEARPPVAKGLAADFS